MPLLSGEIWKTRIEILWIVLAVLYSASADNQRPTWISAQGASTGLLLASGALLVMMLVHLLNRPDHATPRDLLLWAFGGSTVCATSALKSTDVAGAIISTAYAGLFGSYAWSPLKTGHVLITRLLLRCVICSVTAGFMGFMLTGALHRLQWNKLPFVTIFPVSAASFGGLLFAVLADCCARTPQATKLALSLPCLVGVMGIIFFAASGYVLLPEQLQSAWGTITPAPAEVGALLGASLALLVGTPLAALFPRFIQSSSNPFLRMAIVGGAGGTLHGLVVATTNLTTATRHAAAFEFVAIELASALATSMGLMLGVMIMRRISPTADGFKVAGSASVAAATEAV